MTARIPHDEHGRKLCSKCRVYKPLTDYHKDKRAADGFQRVCKACTKEYTAFDYQRRADYWKQPHLAERARERSTEWRRQHPGYNDPRRRERLKAGGMHTHAEWRALCAFYDHRCLCCGIQLPISKLTIDHVVPVVRGGANTIDNLQPLCLPCNQRKGTRTIDYRTERPQ